MAVLGLGIDLLTIESGVFAVEALGYWVVLKVNFIKATLLSLVANFVTIALLIVVFLLGITLF